MLRPYKNQRNIFDVLRPGASRRQRLVERSELEWLGDARPARAIEEPAHLLVHEVARREDHALGMGGGVTAWSFIDLLARQIRHAQIEEHGVVFRALQADERVLPTRSRLDLVTFVREIA